jgi:hypothetical protein
MELCITLETYPHNHPPIERGNKKQLPLKLTWGLTIHKPKRLMLEKYTINIGKQERHGMAFTAIS